VRFVHVLSTGLAGLLSLGAFVFDSEMPQRLATASGNPWVGFHAILAIFSYGIFAVLALTSLMYLLQHSALRRRHGGHLFSRMPAIGKLEEVNARLILTGVTLFSIGVGVGALNVLSADGTVGAIKLAIALGVWAIYLALLYLRQSQRLFGAPFAWACLCAFLLAMLTLQPLTVSTHPGADASAPVAPADNE
jgi:ABC-type uncharacterized transport system permease subunit